MFELINFSIKELRENKRFLERIRWGITPKIWFKQNLSMSEDEQCSMEGFMFYVDVVDNKPVLVIMRTKLSLSKTVGYVEDVPEDLLAEALNCTHEDCIGGMYPITERLEDWLKKELGLLPPSAI